LEKADIILHSGTIVTMNENFDLIHNGMLVIKDDKIIAVGTREALDGQYSADDSIDCSGQYILPGLVNAHTHVPMTLLRGMADDLRLDVWLMGYIMPVEREFVSPEMCKLGTSLACAEMIRGGVTAFADMYYFEADVAEATAEAGLRALLCESILKFPTPDAGNYDDSLSYTRDFMKAWQDHPLITPSIAPHAPYSTTGEILQECVKIVQDFDAPMMMIHVAETEREVEDNLNDFGKTVVPHIKDHNVLDVPINAAHCVHIDEHEMRMFARHGASVAHCPSANLKLSSGIAPITQMLEFGINVAIGTDGPASNNDLDMFEEMRLAALLAKVTPLNPTALPAQQALQMATINGARALGMGDVTGSLEVGKYADVIVLDASPLHNIPHFDFNPEAIYSQIVYASKSADVQHTIVNGKVLMRDRALNTIDEPALHQQSATYAEKVGKFLEEIEQNPLHKLVATGVGVERQESFEIQMKARISDPNIVEELLAHEHVEVLKSVHYRQYDSYFVFEKENTRIRYREDDRIDGDGNVEWVRQRLTYTTSEKEVVFNDAVVLSRSRFISPATQPLRFYREYFQADDERELHKDRRRWRVLYKGVLYFINVDKLTQPQVNDFFLEIKTRTWSQSDARNKADFVHEMMDIMNIDITETVKDDYMEMT
jgi:5-methylthioadenosine/S-adenosylhomocysteine deaminase